MKNIFEPGDFEYLDITDKIRPKRPVESAMAANAKLQSLGIDSETPGKLKRLEASAELLERHIHAIRAVAFELGLKSVIKSTDEMLILTGSELSASEMWQREYEYRDTLTERLSDLERQIAEAPVMYCYKSGENSLWFGSEQQASVDTHRARLVRIEELPKGEV